MTAGADRSSADRSSLLGVGSLVVLVGGLTVAALTVGLPSIDQLRADVDGAGARGPVLFVLGYALVTLAPVPKSVLSVAGGLLFGFGPGVLLVLVGSLLGAQLAFVLGRRLGREAVERWTGARVARVDALLRERGLLAVLGLRLVPVVPFTGLNYAAGLSAVSTRDYTLGTAVGILPGTLAAVALGAYGVDLLSVPSSVSLAQLAVVLAVVAGVAGALAARALVVRRRRG